MALTKQQLGKDPDRDKLLMRRAALLCAAGKSDKEINEAIGVSTGSLAVWRTSPLWQVLVEQYVTELEERGVQSLVDELTKDGPANLSFIKSVRDGQFQEPKEKMDLRLRAAKMLLDKQAPNADVRAQNEGAARIILDGKMLGQVLHALRDVGVIDVTADSIDKATGNTIPELLGAKTPEEFAKNYKPSDPEDDL